MTINYKNDSHKIYSSDLKFNYFKENISIIFKESNFEVRRLTELTVSLFLKIEKSKGTKFTVLLFKELFRFVSRKMLDQDVKIDQTFWLKTNKKGFPKIIGFLRPIIASKDIQDNRFVMTLMGCYKLIHLEPSFDVSTIIGPQKSPLCAETIEDINKHIPDILRILKIGKFKPSNVSPLHVTTKASATGSLAMGVTSITDLLSVQRTGDLEYIRSISKLVFNKSSYESFMILINNSLDKAKDIKDKNHPSSRLHFISEGGGKTRVICIPDI
jgi:hypothetical protein